MFLELSHGSIIETAYPSMYGEGAKPLSQKEGKAKQKAYAIRNLRLSLDPKDTIYTVLRHVSASGMSRRLDVFIMFDNEPHRITNSVAYATGYQLKDGQIVVGGCGTDAGFSVVYSLGCALWPEGTPVPHGTRNGQPDSDGGYALKHRWI